MSTPDNQNVSMCFQLKMRKIMVNGGTIQLPRGGGGAGVFLS